MPCVPCARERRVITAKSDVRAITGCDGAPGRSNRVFVTYAVIKDHLLPSDDNHRALGGNVLAADGIDAVRGSAVDRSEVKEQDLIIAVIDERVELGDQ